MTQLYEGMFLLDNQAVRDDWGQAKAVVTDVLAKHGAQVKAARRWDERRLAYPIKGHKRATYLLTYFEQDGASSAAMRRDLDIQERVLRYLILTAGEIPEGEVEQSQAELADDFSVPPPPMDDEPASAVEEADETSSEPALEEAEATPAEATAPEATAAEAPAVEATPPEATPAETASPAADAGGADTPDPGSAPEPEKKEG